MGIMLIMSTINKSPPKGDVSDIKQGDLDMINAALSSCVGNTNDYLRRLRAIGFSGCFNFPGDDSRGIYIYYTTSADKRVTIRIGER